VEVLREAVTPESVSAGLSLPAGRIPAGFYFIACSTVTGKSGSINW